jgi:tRNA (cytidine32/guanosine34-2'-O)-methyltransferase
MGKSSKDKRDIYYRLAKEQGWRARSAFKLLQLDEQFDLLRGATRVVDLCAAPGSWSQVLSRALVKGERTGRQAWEDQRAAAAARARGVTEGLPPADDEPAGARDDSARQEEGDARRRDVRIVAIDLQPMSALDGVTMLQADITHPSTVPLLLCALNGDDPAAPRRPVDLVLSDGAPDVTGLHDLDAYVQRTLVAAALALAAQVLRPGGSFVAKMFRSGEAAALLAAQARALFADVAVAKPRSSRASSLEAFLVCRGFAPLGGPGGMIDGWGGRRLARPGDGDGERGADGGRPDRPGGDAAWIAPFLACGDLSAWDSDASCPLPTGGEGPLDPVQPPTAPPYARALAARRAAGGAMGKTTKPASAATAEGGAMDTSFADLLASLPPESQEKPTEPSSSANATAKKDPTWRKYRNPKAMELKGLPPPGQVKTQLVTGGAESEQRGMICTSLADLEQRVVDRVRNGVGRPSDPEKTG